jgi:YbbR-like protein
MRWATRNFWWKLFSVAIAFVLWYFVVGQPDIVATHTAPVFYKNLQQDLDIGSDAPETVHLDLRGPEGKLGPSGLQDTSVTIDLAAVRGPGERTFTIGSGEVDLPLGVKLVRALPSQLRLRFERVSARTVPVKIRTTGDEKVRIVNREVEPAELKITGPESRVQQLDSAQTDPIDLSAAQPGRSEFRVNAYVSDPRVRFDGSPAVRVRIWTEPLAK